MTESEAKGFIQGKLDCMNKCGVFNKEDNISDNDCDNCEYCYSQGNFGNQKEAFQMAINALENQEKINEMGDCYIITKNGVFEVNGVDVKIAIQKQISKKVDKTEITLSKRKFATELKQLVHKKCVEINHYVSGCNSPFSYLQIEDVQESLRDIENTLNIKIKEL